MRQSQRVRTLERLRIARLCGSTDSARRGMLAVQSLTRKHQAIVPTEYVLVDNGGV
jgi:hypothetical protein